MTLAMTLPSAPAEYTKRQKAWMATGAALLFVGLFFAAQAALAITTGGGGGGGGGGTTFDPVWQILVDWTTGTLGRIITLLIILVGIVAGVLTQSLGAFAVGLGAGLGLYFAPTIITAVFSATVVPMAHVIEPVTHAITPVVQAMAPLVGM